MATNYDNLSDAELDRLVSEKLTSQPGQAVPQKDLNSLSDAELDEMVANKLAGRDIAQYPVSTLGADQGVINEGQPIPQQAPQYGDLGDRAMTQLESFGNTVSMGYLPQIQAVFEKINPDPSGGLDEQLKAEGFTLPDQSYVNLRDENIKRQESQGQRNPYDQAAGMIGGIVTSAPMLGAAGRLVNAGSKGASGFARLKDSARIGASLGGVSNPGDIEGVVNPFQSVERLKNTGVGAGLGVLGQSAGEGIAKAGEVVKSLPKVLESFSKNAAFKSTGAMLKDFRAAFGRNSTEEIGETLIKKNIVAAGDSFDDIAKKATAAKEETGKVIGATYKTVEDALAQASQSKYLSRADRLRLKASEIDGAKIARSAKGKISKMSRNDTANSKLTAKAQESLDNIESRGKSVTMSDLLEIKTNLDGDINYSKKMGELPAVQQQLKHIRDSVNKMIQDRVRVAGKIIKDDSLITNLKQSNKEYGHLATAQRTAADRVSRESANKFFGLTAHIDGVGGGMMGVATGDNLEDKIKNGVIGFFAGKMANKSSRYALPVASRAAEKFGRAMQKPANFAKYGEPLIEAAKRSPEEFQALLNQFGKDPEFKRLSTQGVK